MKTKVVVNDIEYPDGIIPAGTYRHPYTEIVYVQQGNAIILFEYLAYKVYIIKKARLQQHKLSPQDLKITWGVALAIHQNHVFRLGRG